MTVTKTQQFCLKVRKLLCLFDSFLSKLNICYKSEFVVLMEVGILVIIKIIISSALLCNNLFLSILYLFESFVCICLYAFSNWRRLIGNIIYSKSNIRDRQMKCKNFILKFEQHYTVNCTRSMY